MNYELVTNRWLHNPASRHDCVLIAKRKTAAAVFYLFNLWAVPCEVTEAATQRFSDLCFLAWRSHATPCQARLSGWAVYGPTIFACSIPTAAVASFEPRFLSIVADDSSYSRQ